MDSTLQRQVAWTEQDGNRQFSLLSGRRAVDSSTPPILPSYLSHHSLWNKEVNQRGLKALEIERHVKSSFFKLCLLTVFCQDDQNITFLLFSLLTITNSATLKFF